MAQLNLFYQGQPDSPEDGHLWRQVFDGTNWLGVQHVLIGGDKNLSYAPSVVVWRNILHVFHQGAYENGQLWVAYFDGHNWHPDQQVPGVGMSFSPSAVVFNDKLYVFHPGSYESGELWYTVADGTNWSQDHRILENIGGSAPMSLSPSAVVWNNVLYVFFQNGEGGITTGIGNPGAGILYFIGSTDGIGWENVDPSHQPTRWLPDVGMSFSPSAVVWRNMIHVFHEGLYENQQLWYSYHDGQNWHPDQQVPGVVIGTPPDAERLAGGKAQMSPSAVVYNNNCYVFYLNQDYMLSYKFADGTKWSQETEVPNVPAECGWVGCAVF